MLDFRHYFKQKPQPSELPDPYAYVIDVQRDEAALGRFVKRLSVSGAEKIQVEITEERVVRVRMRRPFSGNDWENTVDALVDRCGLRRVDSLASPTPSHATPARLRNLFGQE